MRPRCLFCAVSETLGRIPDELIPTAPKSVVVLARKDRLYLQREYDAYLSKADPGRVETRFVTRGHDWPITHPALVERELLAALDGPQGASASL